jgi:alkanesulfonate monooxygenase SsuD/methylene tetrahydromethanopterin reductase-like flavin-dependent oxidoreductase (luciferase family)
MDEALDLLIRCLEGGEVSFEGRFYEVNGLEMTPRPVQEPRPPILTAGGGRRALERSVRLGCEGLAFHPPPDVYEQYAELLVSHGHRPEDQQFATIVLGYAAPDGAWAEVGPHATWIWDHYTRWLRAAGQGEIFSQDPQVDFIIGDPEHWRRSVGTMLAMNASVPCHHLVVELVMAGMSHETRVKGIEYFAAEVLPILRDLDPAEFGEGNG